MNIIKKENGDALEVALQGRLDTMTAPQLEQELKSCLGGVKELTLDLEGLEYISSAGLRILLKTQKQIQKTGTMIVRGANDMVLEIFEVTGFNDILTIE